MRNHLYTVFRVGRINFFLVNRVENQNEPKRPQSEGGLGLFWFSTRPSAIGGTKYNLQLVSEAPSVHGVNYNQCLPLSKAELKTKTNPNGQKSVAIRVRFGGH